MNVNKSVSFVSKAPLSKPFFNSLNSTPTTNTTDFFLVAETPPQKTNFTKHKQ